MANTIPYIDLRLVCTEPSDFVEEIEPSDEDIELTKRIVEAGKIIGIELLDHVIFTRDGYLNRSQI